MTNPVRLRFAEHGSIRHNGMVHAEHGSDPEVWLRDENAGLNPDMSLGFCRLSCLPVTVQFTVMRCIAQSFRAPAFCTNMNDLGQASRKRRARLLNLLPIGTRGKPWDMPLR